METVRATAMATVIAAEYPISRSRAFDMIVAIAKEIECNDKHRYSEREASELFVLVRHELSMGRITVLDHPTI